MHPLQTQGSARCIPLVVSKLRPMRGQAREAERRLHASRPSVSDDHYYKSQPEPGSAHGAKCGPERLSPQAPGILGATVLRCLSSA